jgi:hypothetical protein
MLLHRIGKAVLSSAIVASLVVTVQSQAQQPAAKQSASKQPAPSAAPTQSNNSLERAQKEKILASEPWQQAMFKLDQWFSVQPFYDKAQVEQIKANLKQRVAKMSAADLEHLLADFEEKFNVLSTKEARDAQSWMMSNLAALTDKERAKRLKDFPNPATMTAGQLKTQIAVIQARRKSLAEEQTAFHEFNQKQVQRTIDAAQAAREAYTQRHAPSAVYSPYRPDPLGGLPPFSDTSVGPSTDPFYFDSYNGFGRLYGAGRF